jgi:Proteasome subunit
VTIIVGVKCTDGVVIGADSIATSSTGAQNVMQIESNDKLRIFGGKVIVGATGAVGYTQRMHYHLDRAVQGGGFLTSAKHERPQLLCRRFLSDLQASLAPNHSVGGLRFGALLATEISGEPCLIEYAADTFQPEYKEQKLFYASIGSGQPLADPFLAFVSRVLWKNILPDVRLGRFGLFWALMHTIKLAPGMVGFPIKMAVLTKVDGAWCARESPDTQESEEFVSAIEERIAQSVGEASEGNADISPVPVPSK